MGNYNFATKGGKKNSNQKNNNYWTKLKQLREQSKEDCSSEEEHKENALASGADEGRD